MGTVYRKMGTLIRNVILLFRGVEGDYSCKRDRGIRMFEKIFANIIPKCANREKLNTMYLLKY